MGGLFCACKEETDRVVGERELALLRDLATRTADCRTFLEVCRRGLESLALDRHDLPFAAMFEVNGDRFDLLGRTGIDADHPLLPHGSAGDGPVIPLLRQAWERRETLVVEAASLHLDAPLPSGPWSVLPTHVALIPVVPTGRIGPGSLLLAGLNPYRQVAEPYRDFLGLIASQLAASIANALAYEEEKRRAEELAELDRAKTAFFSNISHEFRTPLTLMLGPVEDLLDLPEEGLPEPVRRQLDVVSRNGDRLLRLVNALLEFSRIEAGRIRATYRPTDLATFTADLASLFRSACERAGLDLRVDTPPLSRPVYVDQEMWEKVVLNLLSNAFKYTFEGGIELALTERDGEVELRVSDTGIGVPEEEIPRLFERFHRVESARGRTHEGSGIGLALVNELVRLHGGSISAASRLGVGTTLTVTLPVGREHLPADQIEEESVLPSAASAARPFVEEVLRWLPEHEPQRRRAGIGEVDLESRERRREEEAPRILVVDDNADMRQYIERLLEPTYEVVSAHDGLAALEMLRDDLPALVLTDVMMPRLDGFGLLRELRGNPATAPIPVIMLSARAGEESRVEGMEAGADDYLAKPFSARELLARVGAHVEMARLRSETAAEREALLEAQRRQSEFLQRLLDEAPIAIAVVEGEELRFSLVNPAYEALAGGARNLVGRTHGELFPESASRRLMEQVRAEGRERRMQDVPSPWPINGGPSWWDGLLIPLTAPAGEPAPILIMAWDVTERKRSEEALRESRQYFRMMADTAPAMLWITDAEGSCTFLSRGWEEQTGQPVDEGIGNGWLDIVHPDDRERSMRTFVRAQAERRPFSFEYRLRDPAGGYRWALDAGRPRVADDGTFLGFIGSVIDIHEMRRAHEALHQSEQRLRLAIDAGELGDWYWDIRQGVCTFGETGAAIFGLPPGTRIERAALHDIVHPDDLERSLAIIREALTDRREFSLEHRVVRRDDGEVVWVAAHGVGLFEGEELTGVIGVVQDITERRLAQEELRRQAEELVHLNEALREQDRRKDAFLATLAHELRNPLAPIRSGLELLRLADDDRAMATEIREMMERQTAQLISLVNDLLDVSRITRGRLELRREEVLLADVIRNAIDTSRPLIEAAGHRLVLSLPERPIRLDVDPHRISQVFSNLLNNATKYTPQGGTIELSARIDQGEVEVVVRDNGIGIPAGKLEEIFEMFVQVDGAIERGSPGLGVGLTLVRSLIDMHNGTVSVASEGEGEGSTFTVRLPLATTAARSSVGGSEPVAAVGEPRIVRRRVLVVDDNDDAAATLSTIVRMLGNDVRTASDGAEAIELAEAFQPEVIFMDLGMPRMDGIEAARHIRRQPWGASVTLVAVTGWGQESDRARTSEAGFDHHIVKPTEPAVLRRLLMRTHPNGDA